MPNTKPNLKSKAGNVTHPFSEKTVNAANKIYGAEHEREMPHPLRQVNPNIQKGSSAYNALDEMGLMDKLTKPAPAPLFPDLPAEVKNFKFTLPSLNLPTNNFTSGSYTNPQGTTDSSTNDKSSAFNYSFLEDITEGPQSQKQDPNRNKFGFWKRDDKSLQARIDDAKARGKHAKVARLERKQKNFRANQEARSGIDSETGDKIPAGKENADPNFWDKINPKNWL